MKRTICLISALMLGVMCFGCVPKGANLIPTDKIEGSSVFVKKVENVPDDFMLGMDISSVLSQEKSGVKYYDFDGKECDLFTVLAKSGVNTIRVRVWNDPFDADGNGFGGGNCDINAAVEIGKRATKAGMRLIVDFHLSDFWADPSKQTAPRAWMNMSAEEKGDATYNYIKESLGKLKAAKVDVALVQIGNETDGAIAGENSWDKMQYIFKGGSKAIREVLPEALVAVHFANPEKAGTYAAYAHSLMDIELDYDVFASSYYPYWHGTLDNLAKVLNGIAITYGKKVMVMETSYAYTYDDTDFSGNTIGEGGTYIKPYPFTVQGQVNEFRDVVDTVVNRMRDGIGVIYWEGAWITVGQNSWEENHELWEKYGSGWATSYAAAYDPNDAGKYYGGSAVDNQALFAPDGKPLESLLMFNLVRYGNDVPIKADAIEDKTLSFVIGSDIELPETVNAVMNDNSKTVLPVKWSLTDADIEKMKTGGVAKYNIEGEAGGLTAKLTIDMIEQNLVINDSFETGLLEPWRLIDRGHENELYVEKKLSDSLTGQYHMHFWSAAEDSVDFSLEQDIIITEAGLYKFSMSIMGGDCGETDIYIYVLVDGVEVGRAPLKVTYYNEWDTAWVTGFFVEGGQTVTVGIHVKCKGAGAGAWGKIDDAKLNSDNG
ncbi:MAG: glycosyl hydrolase 53 family protein [Clostridiales bacterium]|nr:glycosyl hydrolase 53 family protein [Clostridiales bacterium]